MKALNPCCDFATFWEGFMFQWRKRYTADAVVPDFVVAKAKIYWETFGMSGFEVAETAHRKFEAGGL